MAARIVPGPDAWKSLAKSGTVGLWRGHIARFGEPLAGAHQAPKFTLAADDAFFRVGSCFARNIKST